MSIEGERETELQQSCNITYRLYYETPSNCIKRICETVRTRILEWSLKLEDVELNIPEGQVSHINEIPNISTTNIHINNSHFHGTIGNINQSTIEQNFHQEIKTRDFDSLANFLKTKLGISDTDIIQLQEAIKTDNNSQERTKKLSTQVLEWANKISTGVIKTTTGIAGTIATDMAGKAISSYLGIT